jgi:hypothetical protein
MRQMDGLALSIIMAVCIAVGWLLGIRSVPENQYNTNVYEIRNCKDIKIDTISYNYRDSTYVLQLEIKQ